MVENLQQGSYRPGTHWSGYMKPHSWGATNPFGVRDWFGGWSPVQQVKNWWSGKTTNTPLDEKVDIAEKIRQSREFKSAIKQFRQGKMNEDQFREVAGAGLPKFFGLTDFDRNMNRAMQQRAAIGQRGKELVDQWKGVDTNMAESLAKAYEDTKYASVKQAAFDWIVNRGNSQFNQQLESSLKSPKAAEPFFTRIRDRMEGKKPGFFHRLNPTNWMENWYLSDPRSMQHIKSRMAQRLSAGDTQRRLFPNRPGALGSLAKLMGPIGWGGAGLGLYGLLKKDPMLALLGLGGVAGQFGLQYSKAKDPRTWFNAFASPRTQQEIAQRDKARQFLSTVSGLTIGKSASESDAGVYSWTPPDPNPAAAQLLQQHFPVETGRQAILDSTNMSLADKWKLLSAFDRATVKEPERGTTTIGKIIPSLVGAGLGWLGASLAAPIFGLDAKSKQRLGIGASALGAILNNPNITKMF